MIKKQIAAILAAALLVSTVAGCQSAAITSTSSASEKSDASTTESSAAETDDREMEGNLYLTGRPLVKEQESFTMFCDDGGLPEDKILYPMLEEQTNVKIDLMLFPHDVAKEKKNVLLNSGDYPDVMGGWILKDTDILTQGMDEQVYIPLDDLFDKYGPKMNEILDLPGVRAEMTLPDGNIYSFPYVVGEPSVIYLPWINYAWLDKLGLKMPTTTEEFRTVLQAFKEQDANGNGDANDEIPFSAHPNNLHLGAMAGWFGVNASGGARNVFFALNNGKLQFGPSQEGYREFIKYFASLNAEGLLDSELFTQDATQFNAKMKNSVYGCTFSYDQPVGAEVDGKARVQTGTKADTDYDPLPVLKNDYTDKPVYRRNGYGTTLFRTQLVITDKAKNPATIMRWWDNMFQLDNSMLTNAGPLGWGIELLEDGTYRYIDTSKASEEDKTKYGWGNIWTQNLPKYQPIDQYVAPAVNGTSNYDIHKVAQALYEPYLDDAMPSAWVTSDQASRQATLETDINNFVKQKMAEWISGQKDVEAEWDDYLAQLDKLGVAELQKMRQEAIDGIKVS